MEATTALTVSSAFLMRDAAKDALKAANDALSFSTAAGDKKGEGRAWMAIGASELVGDKAEEGLKAATTALTIFRDLEDKKMEVPALGLVADAHILREKPRLAVD